MRAKNSVDHRKLRTAGLLAVVTVILLSPAARSAPLEQDKMPEWHLR